MNTLDIIFAVGVVIAALGGWRLGFIQRVAGWVGLIAGVTVTSRLLPSVIETPDNATAADLIKSLAIIVGGGIVGQTLGHIVGGRVRRLIKVPSFGHVDSAAGSVLGVIGVVITAWMIVPTMAQIDGWPAEAARSSEVAGRLTRTLGSPPNVLSGVGDALGVQGLPGLVQNVGGIATDPAAPQGNVVPESTLVAVRRSVVKITGPACGRVQSGSGFVAAPGLVVTNAHVVAGSEALTITTDEGDEVAATLRFIDIEQDIAVVSAPSLDRPALPLADAAVGDEGSVLGYPGGGPLRIQPYRVAAQTTANGKDIYDESAVSRDILVLGSRIGPGDSGGPLVTAEGTVAGIAFGIAPDDDQTAYAIASELLTAGINETAPEPIGSGRCR